MAGLLASYQRFLARSPLVGNAVSAAALFATGDCIAQQLVEKKGSKHDFVRTGRIVVWGGGIFAPVITQWFKVLQKVQLGNTVATTATRVALDQFLCAPVVVTGFFAFMSLTEGKDLGSVRHKLRNDLLPTLKANWGVFIPTQAINFSVVPPAYRLLTINLVNIPWNTYLSIQANKK